MKLQRVCVDKLQLGQEGKTGMSQTKGHPKSLPEKHLQGSGKSNVCRTPEALYTNLCTLGELSPAPSYTAEVSAAASELGYC